MGYLKIRVTPRAKKNEIAEWIEDPSAAPEQPTLRVRIKAAPERGKANEALVAFLASRLGLPPSHVTLHRGAGSREKLVRIEGLSSEEVRARIDR